ncbi:MAG: PEGA domain-containing protein [Candidatus Saccharimonadales bacterium]
MYHPPSKRKQLVRQVAVYTAMSVTIIVAVTALVFIMLGYDFNKKDGRIEQGGLLQFVTSPSGAEVTVDGNMLGSQTPSKSTAFTGSHYVTMSKTGYKTWQKSIDVLPGSILWLNYARLIPTTLTQKTVADFTTVSSTASSSDNKWLAVKEDPTTPAIKLVNINSDATPVTTLNLPATTYTPPTTDKGQSFFIENWDQASRYIIVKHVYDTSKIEWLVVDSQDVTKTKNITLLLGIDASKVVFSKLNNRVVFAQIGADVRQIDLDAETLSRPLISNVAEFSLSDSSTITYVTNYDTEKKIRSVGYYQIGADKPYILRNFNEGVLPLHVAIASYFNENYITITYGDSVDIFKGSLPKVAIESSDLSTVASFKLEGGAQWLKIENSGRFVVMQNGGVYSVYDLELNKLTTTTVKSDTAISKELPWLDGYTVWNDTNGTVRLYEFDGSNQQDIMSVVPGLSVTLNPNGSYVYGFNKNAAGAYELQRTKLIL